MNAIIGYWGRIDTDEKRSTLAETLDHVTSSYKGKLSSHHSRFGSSIKENHCHVAQITFIETVTGSGIINSGEESLTASLSASGIKGDADIRIRADRHSLTLSRDSFGRVMLFWTKQSDAIWFSTRLELLLQLINAQRVCAAGLYGYACFSYVPTPLTVVEGIHAVPAGREIVITYDNKADTNYFQTLNRLREWREDEELISDEQQAKEQLRCLLEQDIESQIADLGSEPVGVFLSGGLDSSIAAALLVRAGISVRAYALDFGEYGLSELPSAEQVASHLNIPLVKVRATPRRIQKAIEATAQSLDLPFGDGVTVPLYLLSKAASRECCVIFNGEGGDQLFAGWTNKPIIASGVYASHAPANGNFDHEYLRTFHRLHEHESESFTSEVLNELRDLNAFDWLEDALDPSHTPSLLHRLRRANLMLKGAQNIQPRATNIAFANGLNVRSPFCYKPLARWSFRLAGDLFLRGPCEKYLLKRAVEDLLPPDVVWKEKRGMGVPLTQWLLGPLWRMTGRWLAPEILKGEDRWQSDLPLRVALGRLSGHHQGRRIGEILWLLIMWQAWRKMILKEEIYNPFYNHFWLRPGWWEWRFSRKEEKAWQL